MGGAWNKVWRRLHARRRVAGTTVLSYSSSKDTEVHAGPEQTLQCKYDHLYIVRTSTPCTSLCPKLPVSFHHKQQKAGWQFDGEANFKEGLVYVENATDGHIWIPRSFQCPDFSYMWLKSILYLHCLYYSWHPHKLAQRVWKDSKFSLDVWPLTSFNYPASAGLIPDPSQLFVTCSGNMKRWMRAWEHCYSWSVSLSFFSVSSELWTS